MLPRRKWSTSHHPLTGFPIIIISVFRSKPPPPGWCRAQWGRWYIQINFWRIVSNLPWYIQITPGQVWFIHFLECATWYHNFDPFHRVWETRWGSFHGVWISYCMALHYMYVQLDLRHTLKQFSHMLQTMSVVWYLVDSPRSRTMIDPSARVVGYCADRIITNYHGGRSSRAIIGRGLSAHHYKPALHWGVAITAIITIPIITSLPTTPGVRAKKIKRAIWSN